MVNRNLDKTAGDFYPGYHHPKLLIGYHEIKRRAAQHKGVNNRAKNSHQPTRGQQKQIHKFKSPKQAQRFLTVHGISSRKL